MPTFRIYNADSRADSFLSNVVLQFTIQQYNTHWSSKFLIIIYVMCAGQCQCICPACRWSGVIVVGPMEIYNVNNCGVILSASVLYTIVFIWATLVFLFFISDCMRIYIATNAYQALYIHKCTIKLCGVL